MISLPVLGRPILLGALILCLSFGLQAAPPKTLDYQGYLANSGGVPLTGAVNLSVSLYALASGGTSLWTQASSPTLTNGRFTLVLDGSAGNPFPASAFDQQLYVGLTVDTDPEMTPRQPLTSVPSAFEAINSDTLDGLQANEIIDAASDEVRTPISSLPFTINTSGSYYVTQNLDGTSGGINVNVDNVTIDLMGFTLDGNGENDYGINFDTRSKVVIRNGTVEAFGLAGIYNGSGSGGNVVTDVQVIANGSLGSSITHSGILTGNSSRVERCIAKDNGGSGIRVGVNSIVKDSIAENSGGSYGILGDTGSTLTNNAAHNNQGIGIYGSNGSTLTNNTAYSNQGTYGIYGSNGSTLTNNAAHNNQGIGIYGSNGSTLTNNTAYSNQGTYGIYGSNGSTLTNNTAYSNQGWGIYAAGSNSVIGNTVYSNNQSLTANQGGLRIGSKTLAQSNTADRNYDTGIYISGIGNMLRNNHATDALAVGLNSRCFNFASSNNVAVGNSANGCNVEFDGLLPPAARFIDNIGW